MRILVDHISKFTRDVYPLLVEFGRAAGLPEPFASEDEFCSIWDGIVDADAGVTILALDNGRIAGCLGALFSPRVYWSGGMATETFFWVRPRYRGGLTAARLLRQFEVEAKGRGCAVACVGHKSQFRAEEMERFYKRFGYSPLEVMYQKEL